MSANGCPAPAAVTVFVIDARCGSADSGNGGNGGKVAVCHRTGSGRANDICVAPNAVPARLRQGDSLGSCTR